jgi:hypothetical protein
MSHLATLANQVTFKKSFSDKEVLEAFVRDVTGEVFIAGKIETEKEFTPSVGKVSIKYDIFAESEDGRVILEIQRVRYDSHFDRFMYYFLAGILEQVGSHHSYSVPRKVIAIVLLTAPYKNKDLSGRLVEDPLLITNLDPRTLEGETRTVFGHTLFYLNPRHDFKHLPKPAQEWLHLVNQSMNEMEVDSSQSLGVQLGLHSAAAIRAAELSLWDGLTIKERTDYVNAGEAEQTLVMIQESLDEERKLVAETREKQEEERRLKEEERRLKEEALQQKDAALLEIERLRALLAEKGVP